MSDRLFNGTRLRRLAPDVCAVVFLTASLAFFYWGFLTGRYFIWDDTLTELYPGANYFARSLHAGHFPLWFPGVHDGAPFYCDPQVGVFYPLQWLLIPFVKDGRLPYLIYQRYIILHYLLGGLLMYAFLKQIKLRPIAALTGALVFCLSGFASLRIVNFVMIQTYIWLPLQLLCVHRLTCNGSRLAWAALVGAAVLSVLAGHQQTTVYCWYLVAGYWLYRCYCRRYQEAGSRLAATRQIAGRDVPKMVGTLALVLGICGVMILPAAQNWLRTSRPHQSFEVIADTSLPRGELLTLLVPNFFGTTQSSNTPVPFWGFDSHSLTVTRNGAANGSRGFWEYWEMGAYDGQIFWLAVVLILFNWRKMRDRQSIGFFLVAWLVATWFMLGRYGGLFQVLYHALPGASLFRGPVKMSCVATFAAAVAVAWLVDLLEHDTPALRYWPVFLPMAGCLVLALFVLIGGNHLFRGFRDAQKLSWSLHETLFALAVAAGCAIAVLGTKRCRQRWAHVVCLCMLPAICVVDFYHAFGNFQRSPVSPDVYFPRNDRLFALLQDYREQRGPFRFGQIVRGRIGEEIATFRNLPYFHDFLEVPEGYNSLYLESVARFQSITNEEAKIAIQNITVTMERDAQNKDWLGTRTNSLLRAKFYRQIRRYDDSGALLSALERGEIDWRTEAAVYKLPAAASPLGDAPGDSADTTSNIRFTSQGPEAYSIDYDVSGPGIVFVSEAFYPGWTTDNERIKLTEVFGAFQGIVIPEAGQGRIVVHFSPPILWLSLGISIVSLAITISLVTLTRRERGMGSG
jgi:membrane protein YfhO